MAMCHYSRTISIAASVSMCTNQTRLFTCRRKAFPFRPTIASMSHLNRRMYRNQLCMLDLTAFFAVSFSAARIAWQLFRSMAGRLRDDIGQIFSDQLRSGVSSAILYQRMWMFTVAVQHRFEYLITHLYNLVISFLLALGPVCTPYELFLCTQKQMQEASGSINFLFAK